VARARKSYPASSPDRGLVLALALAGACSVAAGDDGASSLGGSLGSTAGTLGDGSSGSGSGDDAADAEDAAGSGSDGPGPMSCTAPTVACGQLCADLDVDPSNCGACGISCVDPGGEASCAAGECRLGSCAPGFADCDSEPENGCEQAITCVEHEACVDVGGTPGVTDCSDPCLPVCGMAGNGGVELCNAQDDDADGLCDQGPLAGCRKPIHRATGGLGHFYTDSVDEVTGNGFTMEAQDFFFVYAAATPGLVPLYRCNKASSHRFLTSSADCEGTGAPELTLGYLGAAASCDAIPLYRVYLPASDDHFYTTSAPERDNAVGNLGYQDQGVTGYVFPTL
jgi:uncharacterized protein DUF5648